VKKESSKKKKERKKRKDLVKGARRKDWEGGINGRALLKEIEDSEFNS
jgi:hypothetical protein